MVHDALPQVVMLIGVGYDEMADYEPPLGWSVSWAGLRPFGWSLILVQDPESLHDGVGAPGAREAE